VHWRHEDTNRKRGRFVLIILNSVATTALLGSQNNEGISDSSTNKTNKFIEEIAAPLLSAFASAATADFVAETMVADSLDNFTDASLRIQPDIQILFETTYTTDAKAATSATYVTRSIIHQRPTRPEFAPY
jgi:hypothetical protein